MINQNSQSARSNRLLKWAAEIFHEVLMSQRYSKFPPSTTVDPKNTSRVDTETLLRPVNADQSEQAWANRGAAVLDRMRKKTMCHFIKACKCFLEDTKNKVCTWKRTLRRYQLNIFHVFLNIGILIFFQFYMLLYREQSKHNPMPGGAP